MEKKLLCLASPLLSLLGSLQTIAQPIEKGSDLLSLSLEDLINVKVITSSKYLQNNADSPANTHVITAKQITERGYKSLLDLMKNLPGVDIQEYSSVGNYNVITMRGASNNNKFLILKDGVRISTPAGEINAIAENYPLYLAKRVEVLIGPASVNYGADAFAGVINIISFSKEDAEKNHLTLSAGTDHYSNGHWLYSNLLDNDIFINLGLQGHYGQDINFANDYPDLYNTNNTDYQFKNTDEFQFFADAQVNEHFSTGVFHSKITYSSDYTAKTNVSAFDLSYLEESLSSLYAKFDYDFSDKLHSNTVLSYQIFTLGNASNFNNLFTGFEKQYKYGRTIRYSINQDFIYQLNDSHLLLAGLVYDYFNITPRSADLPAPFDVDKKTDEQDLFYPNTELAISFFKHRDENTGVYIQDNWQISDKWRQVTGIRYDHHTLYGDTVNPSFATIFQANKYNVFKLLYAHSFLAPPSSLAFNSFGSFTGEQNAQGEWLSSSISPFRVPNEALQPEKLKNLEINYEHWFNDNSKIKFATFYNQIDDTIIASNDDVPQQAIEGAQLIKTSSFKNIGESTSYGIDISTNINVAYSDSMIEYWLALSFIDGELIDQGISTDLPMVANFKVKSGLTYNYQNTYIISPTLRWIGETTGNNLVENSVDQRTKIDSSFVVDLHGEMKVTKQLALSLTINNLFDNNYYNAPFTTSFIAFDKAPQQGRLLFATMTYQF